MADRDEHLAVALHGDHRGLVGAAEKRVFFAAAEHRFQMALSVEPRHHDLPPVEGSHDRFSVRADREVGRLVFVSPHHQDRAGIGAERPVPRTVGAVPGQRPLDRATIEFRTGSGVRVQHEDFPLRPQRHLRRRLGMKLSPRGPFHGDAPIAAKRAVEVGGRGQRRRGQPAGNNCRCHRK